LAQGQRVLTVRLVVATRELAPVPIPLPVAHPRQ
jgi:hypothetical protein